MFSSLASGSTLATVDQGNQTLAPDRNRSDRRRLLQPAVEAVATAATTVTVRCSSTELALDGSSVVELVATARRRGD
jgi:hypothetical protein